MVIQLVHCRQKRRCIEPGAVVTHGITEALCISFQFLPVLIAVFLHTGQKPGNRLHKRIVVHHRIPLIALQPRAHISIMLSKNNCLRIVFFTTLRNFSRTYDCIRRCVPSQPPHPDAIHQRYTAQKPIFSRYVNILLMLRVPHNSVLAEYHGPTSRHKIRIVRPAVHSGKN